MFWKGIVCSFWCVTLFRKKKEVFKYFWGPSVNGIARYRLINIYFSCVLFGYGKSAMFTDYNWPSDAMYIVTNRIIRKHKLNHVSCLCFINELSTTTADITEVHNKNIVYTINKKRQFFYPLKYILNTHQTLLMRFCINVILSVIVLSVAFFANYKNLSFNISAFQLGKWGVRTGGQVNKAHRGAASPQYIFFFTDEDWKIIFF